MPNFAKVVDALREIFGAVEAECRANLDLVDTTAQDDPRAPQAALPLIRSSTNKGRARLPMPNSKIGRRRYASPRLIYR
jgi:hypothetical protein